MENIDGTFQRVDMNNLQSINGVLRNAEMIHLHQLPDYYKSYESGFFYLLNVHTIDLHCPNLGHFNSIGVRGESTISKTIPVSSSSCYLTIDSIVVPHDKIDVSRQRIKTIQFSLRNVYGNIFNLHGAHCSFPLTFATMD